MTSRNHGTISWSIIACYQPFSHNTETRLAVFVVEILYEKIPMTEMFSCAKLAKNTCMAIVFTRSTLNFGEIFCGFRTIVVKVQNV